METLETLLQAALRHHRAGEYGLAQPLYIRAMQEYPESGDAPHLLGMIADEVGEHETALKLVSEAIRRNPTIAIYQNNLGEIWRRQGNLTHAETCYRKALELDPNYALAHCNLATALTGRGILDEAADHLSQALTLSPELPQAHWNGALLMLLTGDYAAGLPELEWRFRLGNAYQAYPHTYEKPRWDGQAFSGQCLLVHDEQGLGDAIQFARYLPQVKALGGTVILECNPALRTLFTGISGADELVTRSDQPFPADRFDLHVPLMSLPGLFGATPENIPAPLTLPADPTRDAHWKTQLGELPGQKIGLVWAGRSEFQNDNNRSCTLADFAPLAQVPGISLASLQKGAPAEQASNPPHGMKLHPLENQLDDLADTAAAIRQLDLVITVDTAVAHLAATQGISTWILLPYLPDWRWGIGREDSPWYPAARLFRQPQPGEWKAVFEEVAKGVAKGLEGGALD